MLSVWSVARAAMKKVVRRSWLTKVDSPRLLAATTSRTYGRRRIAAASVSSTTLNRRLAWEMGPCTTIATYSAKGPGNACLRICAARYDSVSWSEPPRTASTCWTPRAWGRKSAASPVHATSTSQRRRTTVFAIQAITRGSASRGHNHRDAGGAKLAAGQRVLTYCAYGASTDRLDCRDHHDDGARGSLERLRAPSGSRRVDDDVPDNRERHHRDGRGNQGGQSTLHT